MLSETNDHNASSQNHILRYCIVHYRKPCDIHDISSTCDLTGWISRLISVFAGCKAQIVGFFTQFIHVYVSTGLTEGSEVSGSSPEPSSAFLKESSKGFLLSS